MGLLSFKKPKKLTDTATHNANHQSDSGIAGTYVPNMSEEDQKRWKAKHIKGSNERVEIRKSFGNPGYTANVLLVVYKNGEVQFSSNGKFRVPFMEFMEIFIAVDEAQDVLGLKYGLAEFLEYIEQYIDEEDYVE